MDAAITTRAVQPLHTLQPDLREASRLLELGLKIVKLLPHLKRPEGNGWNHQPATQIDPTATGYGLLLQANKVCSIDPDRADLAFIGMKALGFDLEAIMAAGVRTRSTRHNSGGRSAFAAEGEISWLKFRSKETGTVIEFRAHSENLQDTIPGLVYTTKDGQLCTQAYAGAKRLDDVPPLPDDLFAWWERCSTDIDFLREQEAKFFAAIGAAPSLSISTGKAGGKLAFDAPGIRGVFNDQTTVESILTRHNYAFCKKTQRWSPPTATGAPGVHPIPGKDGLWRSDHASDPLSGTFDAWVAHVVLDFNGDMPAAVAQWKADHPFIKDSPASHISRVSRDGWPDIDPLPEVSAGTPAAFPFNALGPILGAAAAAVARDVQTPDALAAGSVLAAASLAAHTHADVVMPHGQRAPLSLFVLTGAASGDRKSAADVVVLREVEEVRREQARVYLRAKLAAGDDKDAAPPTARSLTVGKGTTEGLQHILRGQSSVGLFTAEGGELLGGHSMREERRSAGLAWLLKAWGGETLDALTRGDGLSVLLGRRVALHAMVQPILLRSLLSDPLAQGQGLLARCLIAEPATLAGTRLFRDARAADGAEIGAFHARMRTLLHRQPRLFDGSDGCELNPVALQMSAAARALWVEFYNEVERQQRAGGELELARAFGSKAAEHAARIAGVVQLVGNPESYLVSDTAMDAGMAVAAFYTSEHVRLTGASQADRHGNLLRLLLESMSGRVLHRDVLQRSPRGVRALKADGINKLLDELVQRGYIRRSGDAWEVNPNV